MKSNKNPTSETRVLKHAHSRFLAPATRLFGAYVLDIFGSCPVAPKLISLYLVQSAPTQNKLKKHATQESRNSRTSLAARQWTNRENGQPHPVLEGHATQKKSSTDFRWL
jgi:hypothetical protein